MIYVIIVIILAVGFVFVAPLIPAFQSKGSPDEIIEARRSKGGPGVLVAYSTRHGSTSAIAREVYDVLREEGITADLRSITTLDGEDLGVYTGFILGSGVLWARLMPNFKKFLVRNREHWKGRPTALFSVSATIASDTPANRKRVASYVRATTRGIHELKPFSIGAFPGRITQSKLSLAEKAVIALLAALARRDGDGDFLDFKTVRVWAKEISGEFKK